MTTNDDGEVEVVHTGFVYVVDDTGRLVLTWPFGTTSDDMANDLETPVRVRSSHHGSGLTTMHPARPRPLPGPHSSFASKFSGDGASEIPTQTGFGGRRRVIGSLGAGVGGSDVSRGVRQ